jgi:hypothetical protein
MPRLARLTIAAVFCVALMVPALAAAKPGQLGFNRTFPIASRLCQRTTNGNPPPKLKGSVPAVVTACTTLRTSFTNAQNAYFTTVGPIQTQARELLKSLHKTCRQARANQVPGVCKAARQSTRAQVQALRAQVAAAAVTYHATVQAARQTFWATIHALKGGAEIAPDPTVGPTPTVPLPSDGQIATS